MRGLRREVLMVSVVTADLQTRGVTLSRGRHWLELEAPEYDRKLIEINITPGETLRYRFDLAPARRVAATVIPPRPPETMYAIPGCYGGNRPPVAANLPPGCDIARVRVIRPEPPEASRRLALISVSGVSREKS